MIDFERVWLPQIICYARIISTGQLEDQWLGRSAATTSITDPDELHEQIFDDLDADEIWASHRRAAKLSTAATDAIDQFLRLLGEADEADARALIASSAWTKIKEAANVMLASIG
ncbi:hypothetical protein [Hansschlegelia beijingensis]|uniref:Uncharacterized protein n=1 Tax=Hansschlegelia beijingensis TaxID=1133344 RepID=A0A7W6D2B4_9HYPH|nr:hypothetical protein [Hansschlegelia beijingensis]MBB3972807.1 hypothetical protein [Hansschlegelia beijingensis]